MTGTERQNLTSLSFGQRICVQANMTGTRTTPSVDRIFRAFSDRTRLRILNLLSAGELCVCDIVRVLDLPQPKVSRHLAYLRRAGLVSAARRVLDALRACAGQDILPSQDA